MAEEMNKKVREDMRGMELEKMTGRRETAREAAYAHLYELRGKDPGKEAYAAWRRSYAYHDRLRDFMKAPRAASVSGD